MHAFYNKHKHQLVTNYKNITHTGVPPVGDLTEVKPGHNAHTLTSLVGVQTCLWDDEDVYLLPTWVTWRMKYNSGLSLLC